MGFAADGFLIHYSKSGAYESGYVLKNTPRTGTGCVATGPAGGTTVSIDGTVPDGTYTSTRGWAMLYFLTFFGCDWPIPKRKPCFSAKFLCDT